MFSDILCAFCMLHAQSCPDFYIFYAYMSLHCVFIRPCWKHNARQLLTFLSAGTLFLISLLLVIFSWKQDTLCIRSCRASQPCSQLPSSSSRNKLLIFQGVRIGCRKDLCRKDSGVLSSVDRYGRYRDSGRHLYDRIEGIHAA